MNHTTGKNAEQKQQQKNCVCVETGHTHINVTIQSVSTL